MRIFSFGCSFTKYDWPSWSDIIAKDLEAEYHNYGAPGLGNHAIQCLLLEAHLRHNITSDDLILINWSGWSREDKFLEHGWRRGRGNILHKHYYDDEYIQNHWSFENDIIRNATSIITCNSLFDISYQSSLNDFFEPETGEGFTGSDSYNKYFELYVPYMPKINHVWRNYYGDLYYTPFDDLFKTVNLRTHERHADVLQHLDWVITNVYPALGLTIKPETEEWCHYMQEGMINTLKLQGSIENYKTEYPWDAGDSSERL